MIYIENTQNNTGVSIVGDLNDFQLLYDSLHNVVGNEDEFVQYEGARLRILGVCYELRHSLMGDREIKFIDNGLTEYQMVKLSIIASSKNIYFKINVLWPEILFVAIVLNNFLKLYASKKAKRSYDIFTEKKTAWDSTIAVVRLFQSCIGDCIKRTLSENMAVRALNLMSENYNSFDNYITQYIDVLNSEFVDTPKEKRNKSISAVIKNILEPNTEYYNYKDIIEKQAKIHDCDPLDLRLNVDLPDVIDW